MNKNAPYIREIIDRTKSIGGTRIEGKNRDEMKKNVLLILQQQLTQSHQNARKKTY